MVFKSKDLSIWLVPGNDGRVRRINLTRARLYVFATLAVFATAVFFFVAGDYARVQLLRAKSFFAEQRLLQERNLLLTKTKSLNEKLAELKTLETRVHTYEKNVRTRLSELSSVISSATELGILNPAELENASNESSGIGGAEVDCLGNGECEKTFLEPENKVQTINLKNTFPQDLDGLVLLIDSYLDLLKRLPLGTPGNGHLSSKFGPRRSPFTRRVRMHEGIDISLAGGSYVLSTGDGYVKSVRRTRTYGLVVDILHSDSVVTRYAHLSRAFVSEGERICQGEVIALAGSSGRTTGPHLHYELRVDGKAVDPISVIGLGTQLTQLVNPK